MRIKLSFLWFCVLMAISCKQEKQNKTEIKEIEIETFFPFSFNKFQPKSSLPKHEIFEITNKDTTILTKDSMRIYLSKDLFVNSEGIIDKYSLYITSVFTKEKMILTNLQTLSYNTLLESSGMFNISAFDMYGNPLSLNDGKFIGVEINTVQHDNNLKLYYGENTKGKVNWEKPIENEDYLVAIPLPKDNYNFSNALEFFYDTTGKSDIISKSYIATREFLNTRLPRSVFDTAAYFKIYMDNAGKDLFIADSLCMVHEKKSRHEWADKFAKGIYTYNKNSKTGMYVDTIEWYNRYSQKLTKPKIINTYGVDLDRSTAREELKKKGLTEKQIDEAFVLHNRRKRVMQSMDSEKKYTSYFEINKLGWYNFDKELGFDNAQYVYLRTNVTGSQPAYTNLYYVLDNYNSLIAGYNISDNSYCIAQKEDYKFKLPLNEPFTVVAISYTENGILLAAEKFKIKEKNEIKLDMKSISEDSLKIYLDKIM